MLSPLAAGRSSGGTTVGTAAAYAGSKIAVPTAEAATSAQTSGIGQVSPPSTRAASAAVTPSLSRSAPSRSVRRSKRSASDPPNGEQRTTGMTVHRAIKVTNDVPPT